MAGQEDTVSRIGGRERKSWGKGEKKVTVTNATTDSLARASGVHEKPSPSKPAAQARENAIHHGEIRPGFPRSRFGLA
jgi:hypothetical protein